MPRVALLGTGRMGSAIATRLADLQPVLWNRTRARAEALAVGTVVSTPAEAVRDADLVISSLTGAEALVATFESPDGALSAASDQLFVEMSTAGPDAEIDLAAKVRRTGSRMLDAPILGPPTGILAGTGTILVGGEEEDLDRARVVLDRLGEVRYVGPLGSAARLKLVANTMLGAVTVAAAELQVAGEASGLSGEDVFWALRRLVPALEARRGGYLDRRHQPVLFAVRDLELEKDLNLALGMFGGSGLPTPVSELARDLVSRTAAREPDLDISAVIDLAPSSGRP